MYQSIENPPLLEEIAEPPKQLFCIGKLPKERCVAIVGTRRPTREGLEVAREVGRTLAENKITVVSGLARGIDSAAHEGAVDGGGKTIAVLPSGIETVYPNSNAWLARKIVETDGALVSEHKGRYKPRKHDFLARNRIIAGLSELILIIEAGQRSGAINTAHHAIDANRDVMAMPGSISNPTAVGTNRLIKSGAIPMTSPTDVLEHLGLEMAADSTTSNNPDHQAVLDLFSGQSGSLDEIQKKSELPLSELHSKLTEMELAGLITRLPGNYIRINKSV